RAGRHAKPVDGDVLDVLSDERRAARPARADASVRPGAGERRSAEKPRARQHRRSVDRSAGQRRCVETRADDRRRGRHEVLHDPSAMSGLNAVSQRRPTVSVGPVKPGPPAPTKPRLAPVGSALTQNAYSEPLVTWNLNRTGRLASAARSGAPVHVTRAAVLSPRTGTQAASENGAIVLPASSSISTRSSPDAAARFTKRCRPVKRTGLVISVPGGSDDERRWTFAVPGWSIDTNPSRRSVARPVEQTSGSLVPCS